MTVRIHMWAMVLLAFNVAACANIPLATPQPTMESIELLRTSNIAPLALGDFRLAPDVNSALDKVMYLRSNSVLPAGGSYSQYLKDRFKTELIAAGKYDEKAEKIVTAQLTDNQLDGSVTTRNSGRIGAKFFLNSNGKMIFEKQYSVDSSWESAFMGVAAIPAAMNEYAALFRKLVDTVLTDQEFQKAVASH